MLEWVKTLGAVGMERMHFACKKDMNLGVREPNVMDQMVSFQNSYVEALTSDMIIFGDRAFKEEITKTK